MLAIEDNSRREQAFYLGWDLFWVNRFLSVWEYSLAAPKIHRRFLYLTVWTPHQYRRPLHLHRTRHHLEILKSHIMNNCMQPINEWMLCTCDRRRLLVGFFLINFELILDCVSHAWFRWHVWSHGLFKKQDKYLILTTPNFDSFYLTCFPRENRFLLSQ